MLLFTACSPDDYGFGGAQYSADDLVAPNAYTVTIEGNRVILKSNIKDCTPLWDTPNGRSQQQEMTIELPFAGDYEVTFGVETRAGAVFGAPYKFTIAQNDFSMLSNEKYFFLADKNFKRGDAQPTAEELIKGISKKWYPNDKDYGLGCTGPVMYMTPYDPTNTGNYTQAESDGGVYKDVPFGRANWAPNWDPGFQSWLIPDTDPYMDSYMEFTMDAAHGCVLNMYRGEDGAKGASTGVNLSGKYNLANVDLSGYSSPLLSFSDPVFALHNKGFDEVCANYTQDIIVAELTPYYLTLITKRTNDEGNWYIVWNFVSEEVKQTNGACIPKEESGLIEKVAPITPVIDDLATKLFTTEVNGLGMATGSQMTYVINEDTPYDWMWWNGSPNVQAWESVTNGQYNDSWAPAALVDDIDQLTLINKGDVFNYEFGSQSGTAELKNGKLVFDNPVTILTASSDSRTVKASGSEWTVLKCIPGEELQIGIPAEKDEKGNVSSYLVANFTYKAVGGGQTGPTIIKFNNDNRNNYIEADKYFRCQLYNPWGGDAHAIDPADLKVKKNQTLSITLKFSGFTFSQPAKAVIGENFDDFAWEPGCFDQDNAITINGDGTYTLTWTNNTGATCNWGDGSSALIMTMQFAGYATLPSTEEEDLKANCEIVSITVQ